MKSYKELLAILQTQSLYDVMAEHDPDVDPKSLDPATLNLFINAGCLLGDVDQVMGAALDNPSTARLPEDGATLLLHALYESGNGAQLQAGRIAVQAQGDRPNTIAHAAGCLLQAGETRQSMELFARLLQQTRAAPGPSHQRFAFDAICRAFPEATEAQLKATMARLFPGRSEAWIDYGLVRRWPTPERAMRLPDPADGAVERAKHVGSTPPDARVRVALPEEYARRRPQAAATTPQQQQDAPLATRLAEIAAHVATRLARRRADGFAEALAEVRARFAPQAADPVQVISTGRAGTTALFEMLEHGKRYTPFHSYDWITAPRHRWAMVGLLHEPTLNTPLLDALTDLFLHCRGAELLSAYRAGRTPVLVSHWDAVFAPVLAGLFPQARFVSLRRDVDAVIRSMIAKRQFAGAQLALLPFVDPKPEGASADAAAPERLIFSRTLHDDLPYHVAWYLAFTEKLWGGLGRAFGARAEIAIESDALFRGDADALQSLLDGAFPGSGVSTAFARSHFSRPINEKRIREMPVTARVERYQRDAREQYEAMTEE